ncbi:MAG: PilT protein domain-containing protein [Microgenomates group bacterium Gr01-1014_7]|nr:MAG: PilT protein domain-containing protein [Microgenomates group bacterium Gr01-1014_7]
MVDSSIIVKWINTVDEENLMLADNVLKDALEGKIQLLTPELAKYEIGNVLLHSKKLSPGETQIPFHTLFVSPIQFISQSEELAGETYQIAFNLGLTYYDASFLSLARQYNAVLITENIKHQGKSKEVRVISLKDY